MTRYETKAAAFHRKLHGLPTPETMSIPIQSPPEFSTSENISTQLPATGDGEIQELLAELRMSILSENLESTRATRDDLTKSRRAILEYVSAAVQEAIEQEREACALLMEATGKRIAAADIRSRSLVTAEMQRETKG